MDYSARPYDSGDAPPYAAAPYYYPAASMPPPAAYDAARGDASPMSPGLNSAELPHFAAPMDAAECAPMMGMQQHPGFFMPPPPHPMQHGPDPLFTGGGGISPRRGGVRRGAGEFRGGGRGRGNQNQGHHPPFRARGRGHNRRDGGRGFQQRASAVSPSSAPAQPVKLPLEPAPVLAPAPVAPAIATPTIPAPPHLLFCATIWCDTCRVDCSSMEALEAHKNGKRHKRTVQRLEQIEAQKNLMAESATEIPAHEVTPSEVLPQRLLDGTDNIRVIRVARGRKRKQPSEAVRSKRAKRPKEQTRVCTLCNAMCDTQVVFEQHLASKKHTSRIKRFKTPDLAFGPVSVCIPPSELEPGTTQAVDSLFFGLAPHDMLQQEGSGYCSIGIESNVPKEQTKLCTLCNAKCETQAVFQKHLTSKKHTSRIKRFKTPDLVFGPVSVCIPPSDSVPATTQAADLLFFGLARRDMLQEEGSGYCGMGIESNMHQQAVQAGQAKDVVLEPEQDLKHQENENQATGHEF